VTIKVQQIGPGMIQQIQSMCADCQGQGEKFSSKDRCKTCNGHKVERTKKVLEVHIDKGGSFV
jgi:DnaJ-class molecular chaperone